MLNDAVSIANTTAGRMMAGILAMSLDHPIAMALILAGLGAASGAVLLDAATQRP